MVRAIFDFCPSVSEELPLFVGDVIEVLAMVDEFWLLGKKEDVTGKLIIHVQNGSSLLSTWKVKVKWAAEVNRLQNTFVFSLCIQTVQRAENVCYHSISPWVLQKVKMVQCQLSPA